jgi:hypothetical protein
LASRRDREHPDVAAERARSAVGTGRNRIWLIGLTVITVTAAAMLAPHAAQAQFVCNQNLTAGLGGGGSIANNASDVACGLGNGAGGGPSAAFGVSNFAAGVNSVALGLNNNANGNGATALGSSSVASGTSSIAAGNQSQATGASSSAYGNLSTASGDNSSAYGSTPWRAVSTAQPTVRVRRAASTAQPTATLQTRPEKPARQWASRARRPAAAARPMAI